MNRINQLFQNKKENILSIYFTAGSPELENSIPVLESLQNHGVDMVELGIPFSDPLADGPVIQQAANHALQNGMSLKLLFNQLKELRKTVKIPVILMGYLNPIMQYGFEKFCQSCSEVGIDGMIIPDLPFSEYLSDYKPIAEKFDLKIIMLITPETSEERIRLIDENTDGFIYMVSSASTTGAQQEFDKNKQEYFQRIKAMNLKNPQLVGFGISNKATSNAACQHSSGIIVGSKFVQLLNENPNPDKAIEKLMNALKE